MMRRAIGSALAAATFVAFIGMAGMPAAAQTTGSVDPTASSTMKLGPSGLPLPRFVSLKSAKVNLRIGPGLNYPVEWMFLKSGLPVEIIQEFDNWRRVRDADGAEGWINQQLLSGRRTAIVTPWQRGKDIRVTMRREPSPDARVVAQIDPGVIGSISACNGEWCEMEFEGHKGWVVQSQVWGAYPGEQIKD